MMARTAELTLNSLISILWDNLDCEPMQNPEQVQGEKKETRVRDDEHLAFRFLGSP